MDSRCIIYVFSGTGNTRLVAERYRKELQLDTEIMEITSSYKSLPSPDYYDLVGIGYPVHAFNPPEIVVEFVKTLKAATKKKLFIFHTGGEGLPFNDSSSIQIRRILKKNFSILSERHYVMPYNMIYRHSDEMVRHMVTYMQELVKVHAVAIRAERFEREQHMPLRHLISSIFRIEWVYAQKQSRLMKVNKDCSSCGLCAHNCPMNNIRMVDGHPVFMDNCILCVRCSFSCPENAISIGLLEGWKVNGPYDFKRILSDETIPESIPLNELPFLYRGYYRRLNKMLKEI